MKCQATSFHNFDRPSLRTATLTSSSRDSLNSSNFSIPQKNFQSSYHIAHINQFTLRGNLRDTSCRATRSEHGSTNVRLGCVSPCIFIFLDVIPRAAHVPGAGERSGGRKARHGVDAARNGVTTALKTSLILV